jgi:hypothetical protein
MFVIPGYNTVVEKVSSYQGILPVVELDEGHLGIGIDKGPLVDQAGALEGTQSKCPQLPGN